MKRKKLKTIADISAGYPFRGEIKKMTNPGAIPVLQMKDVEDGTINWATVTRSELTGRKSANYLMTGDILFAARGKRNYFILLGDDVPDKSVSSPHFFQIRIKNERTVLPFYLNWFLNSESVQSRLRVAQQGTTTVSIRKDTLENLDIIVPPMDQQRKISELAQAVQAENICYQRLIANNNRLLDGLVQRLIYDEGKNDE